MAKNGLAKIGLAKVGLNRALPTQLDSDDEPLMASDVAPPVRSEVLEAFDLTMADSDTSESSRAGQRTTGEVRQEGSQQLGSALAVRASSQGVQCGRFAALLDDDTERNREDAMNQEFPARRRRRLRITWQEDAVHDSCMDRTVRGAEALIHDLAQRIGAIPVGGLIPVAIQRAEVVAIECSNYLGRSRGQSVHPFDRLGGFKGFISAHRLNSTEARVPSAMPSGLVGWHCVK